MKSREPRAGSRLLNALDPEEMRRRLDELIRERADVRLLYYILGEARISEVMHTLGVITDPVLQKCVPPFPPEDLRLITSDHQIEMFLWTGYLDARQIAALVDQHATRRAGRLRILDFGAGCGRVLRFFARAAEQAEMHAVEVNPAHASWCREHLTFASVGFSTELPPLVTYGERSLDCIYAISVMTHLDRERADLWRRELARLLDDRGILILTTHGYAVLDRIIADSTLQSCFKIDADDARRIRERLAREGFVYGNYDRKTLAAARAGPRYGVSFTDPAFIEREWGRDGLEVLEVIPAGLRGWQDVVVLRRTSAS